MAGLEAAEQTVLFYFRVFFVYDGEDWVVNIGRSDERPVVGWIIFWRDLKFRIASKDFDTLKDVRFLLCERKIEAIVSISGH